MKVGTVPKVTVGVAALVVLIFIGYIGVRQMNAPTVEERVYLSPWENGTVRPRKSTEGLLADTTQDVGKRKHSATNCCDRIHSRNRVRKRFLRST